MARLSLATTILCLTLWSQASLAEAVKVHLERSESGGWQLYRDREPYFIRGAGGVQSLEQLAKAGANSVRTWGADDLAGLLDEAHDLGLTVTVGIWLGHERHGFDYSNEQQVAAQFEKARQIILRYKDHPAVLLWGIGNEAEGFESGDSPEVWHAIEAIAAMAKALDPNHPTMAVTAEIGGARVQSISELAPSIDIHGINSYGGASNLLERLEAAGARKPFVLTEFGPPGSWEAATTRWGAPIELTSTEKAEAYRIHYQRAIIAAPGQALGSYAFTWGFKMEATATWFGMFLSDGAKLGAVDAMTELWSGKRPDNLAPRLQPLVIDDSDELEPGQETTVRYVANDPEGQLQHTRWALRRESGEYLTGGDFRPNLPDVAGAILREEQGAVHVRMPNEPGAYRLFLTIYDAAGNGATANLPLLVKGVARTPMPLSVYHDDLEGMPWVPSGWMGNTNALTLDAAFTDDRHDGERSIKLRYEGRFGWVGVAWQHPANNWGDTEGGFDLSGASALEFWARGEYGGEKVAFGVGLLSSDVEFPDSDIAKVEGVDLTSDWRRYNVPLKNKDLSSIKTGFFVTLTGRSSPVTIYIDSIRFIR